MTRKPPTPRTRRFVSLTAAAALSIAATTAKAQTPAAPATARTKAPAQQTPGSWQRLRVLLGLVHPGDPGYNRHVYRDMATARTNLVNARPWMPPAP